MKRLPAVLLLIVWLWPGIAAAQDLPTHAPSWSLQGPDGKTVRYPEDAAGQPALLMFWPSWCPFSRALQPYVQDIWEDYRDRGVKVWTINIREDRDPVQVMKERGLSFPLLLNGDPLMHPYRLQWTPWVLVMNGEGRILWHRPRQSPSPIQDAIEIRKTLNGLIGDRAVPIPEKFPPPYDLHLKKREQMRDRLKPRTFEASQWVPWVDAYLAKLPPDEQRSDIPANGPIKTGKQALALARQLWAEAYDQDMVRDMAPYQAYFRNGHWVVLGQGLDLDLGQGLVAVINADSGQVIRLQRNSP